MSSAVLDAETIDALQGRPHRFPGLVGIMMAASLCLHLAAIVFFAFGDTLPAATYFLCGQFLLGISILRLVDGAFRLSGHPVLFPAFLFSLWGDFAPGSSVWARRRRQRFGGSGFHVWNRNVRIQFRTVVVPPAMA